MDQNEEGKDADALLSKAAAGDRQALDRLLEMHLRELRRYVEFRLPSGMQARVDAADVVQNAFLVAARRLPDFLRDRPMPFRLWLFHLTRDSLYAEHRKHRAARRSFVREMMVSDASSVRLSSLLPANGSTPSRRARREEAIDKVRAALEMLEEPDREIILSRMMDELSFADIAVLCGCNEAAARQRFGRALNRLCNILISLGWSDHDRAG